MNTIHKYPLPIDDTVILSMPDGAEVLCVQVQSGEPYLWAKVDTDKPLVEHTFYVRGTGHPMREAQAARYIGTVQLQALVFHVFGKGR